MLPSFFKVSCKRFLILMAAYTLTRALFLLWNWPLFAGDSALELSEAFVIGWRFDASALFLTNALSFLLWMLPARIFRHRAIRVLDYILLYVVNFICLGVNFIDVEFVKFIGKRISYDLLFLSEDLKQQAVSVLGTYWYLLFSLLLFVGVVLWVMPALPKPEKRPLWQEGLWRLIAIALIFTAIRGGYQFKPLAPMQAYFSTKHELGLLTLNTPFNIIKTRPSGTIRKTRYFATDKEPIDRLEQLTKLTRPPLGVAKGFNVVILIIESFGSEYTGIANSYKGYTPFFDSLAKKGLFYKYDFANARRSVDGVPAVTCGIPTMMDEPVITSDFGSDRLDCLPKILGAKGYSTYFLHGAHNGSMHFDSFGNLAGFENFVGLNEYPKGHPEDLDETWGVLDEPMLQYAAKILDESRKPTFLTLFTLSSHHPYYIPPKYRGKFPKGNLEIHESIGYTDYSLQKFFETAETKPWFKNTIFVLTADHTQKTEHKEYEDIIGAFRVPLLFYIPGLKRESLPYDPNRITEQIDIMPSVLDLLGIENKDRLLLGQSVFDLKNPGRVFNFDWAEWLYLDSKGMVLLAKPPLPDRAFTHTQTWNMQDSSLDTPAAQERMTNLKAALHYINEGLTHNDLYEWRKKQ